MDQWPSGGVEGPGCQRTGFERLEVAIVAQDLVDEFPR